MIELGVRIGVALAVAGVGITLGRLELTSGLAIGAVGLAMAGLVAFLDHRRWRNRGVAGLVAVLDALWIAGTLTVVGQLDRFGFLVLVPMLWATGRFASDAASMAPLVAASVMVSANFLSAEGFTLPVMLHTVGILIVGLLTNQVKVVVKEQRVEIPVTKEVVTEAPADTSLRETVTSLKSHLSELERSSRRERAAAKVWNLAVDASEPVAQLVAKLLQEESEAKGIVLYRLDASGEQFVPVAATGTVPEAWNATPFDVIAGLGDGQLRHRIDVLLKGVRDLTASGSAGSQLLKDRGRMQGMVVFWHDRPAGVEVAMNAVADYLEPIAQVLREDDRRGDTERRLKEAEILYGVAAVATGAETRASLVSRVVRELGDAVRADHVGVWLLEDEEATAAGTHGPVNRLFDNISFAYGEGLSGWLKTGAPEVYLPDTYRDERIERAIALKRRTGSFVLIPVQWDSAPYGFLTASTQRPGGIDLNRLETLRVVAAELGHALARLESGGQAVDGIMTPTEFFDSVRQGRRGHMVYLNLPKRESLVERYGSPAVELATRRLLRRLRAKLPVGGGICRRDEGDYVAFLPTLEPDAARRWANEAAATASMIGLATPDGRDRIPMALRSKVAIFDPQSHQVSQAEAA